MRLAVKFLQRDHPCFRICKLCAERGELGVESDHNRVRVGSTCLSVAKVEPDCAAHIPPILGGHPRTSSRDAALYYEARTRHDGGEAEVPRCRAKSERVVGRMEIYKHPK
jgi:hypothetical protein